MNDFDFKPSKIYSNTTFIHVVDDKPNSRKDHIVEFAIDHGKPFLIETNLDKQRRLKIVMIDENNNTYEVVYNDKHVRVYHKSNLMVIRM